MRLTTMVPAVLLFALLRDGAQQPERPREAAPAGMRLEDVAWPAAAQRLTADTLVVLPLGGAAVEHGHHLRLRNDYTLAEYLARRIHEVTDVVVAPTLSYHYYPPFVEYAGSTSLALNTARDLTADVARSIARHGSRRFYALNTGISTVQALSAAAKVLASEGTLLRYTDMTARLQEAAGGVYRQPIGNHADEIETSVMLYIDPAAVDMSKASREIAPASAPFHLTRRPGGPGTYSASGVWGDATLATAAKGHAIVEKLVSIIREDIEETRRSSLPQPGGVSSTGPQRTGVAQSGRSVADRRAPGECMEGDDRAIRFIGPNYSRWWMEQDADRLAALWSPEGDMVHPDGFIERTSQVIRDNRASLFMRSEYKASRHSLDIGRVRCISSDLAIADAKWDLRGVTNSNKQPVPPVEGLSTLVLKRREGIGWLIEAYRYTIKPLRAPQPTVLDRPGAPDSIR